MKVVVTGGAGFIGSHACEHFASAGNEVVGLDDLSRARLLSKKSADTASYNWNFLSGMAGVRMNKTDVTSPAGLARTIRDADLVIHTAAQTAVTTSLVDPRTDFRVNLLGTFNVLEAARKAGTNPTIVFTSTNKVYGGNVNQIPVAEKASRYVFEDEMLNGIDESFSIDRCEHTPYGCSKTAADLYVQDYAHTYGLRTAVFRMSCIYGPRQFGVEDQGWVAWFIIAHLTGKKVTVYGDGKQVRDILYVTDLVRAFDSFASGRVRSGVYNMGGGRENTISILELVGMIEKWSGRDFELAYSDWRPGDQKVYVSDIAKARKELDWKPEVGVEAGVRKVYDWVGANRALLE